ncbi:hypothetical protein BC826DRAFT_622196 [Russula brevipes]|nr:hypothetical protein BC826DRAFT_167077 [Russula brevipes]KAI0300829.1 hypothetical protein BC826DRAFT_622196 [Russula brevipes]
MCVSRPSSPCTATLPVPLIITLDPLGDATRRPLPKDASPQDLGSRNLGLAHLARRLAFTLSFPSPFTFSFSASVDRRCVGQLALHTASTVHSCGASVTSFSFSELCPEPLGPKLVVQQIRRLHTLKIHASSLSSCGSVASPGSVWSKRLKLFRVRASVHTTIRVHRAAVYPSLFSRLSTKISQKDYIIRFFLITANNFCVRKKGGMSCRLTFNLSPSV